MRYMIAPVACPLHYWTGAILNPATTTPGSAPT